MQGCRIVIEENMPFFNFAHGAYSNLFRACTNLFTMNTKWYPVCLADGSSQAKVQVLPIARKG